MKVKPKVETSFFKRKLNLKIEEVVDGSLITNKDETQPMTSDDQSPNFVGEGYLTPEQIAKDINDTVNYIPTLVIKMFVANSVTNDFLIKFHSSNFNKLNYNERKELLYNFNSSVSKTLTETLLVPEYKISETPIDNLTINVVDGELFIYKDLLKAKNAGISIVEGYIRALTVYLLTTAVQQIFITPIDPKLLTKQANLFYENMLRSNLYGEWDNYLETSDPEYGCQPIIACTTSICNQIKFYHMKFLYNHFHYLDAECSDIVNNYIGFMSSFDSFKNKVQQRIKISKENIKNQAKEIVACQKFLDKTLLDLSKFTDDEFYRLFNLSYVDVTNDFSNPDMGYRLENIANELLRRPFKNFDLTNKEFPKYKCEYDDETGFMKFYRSFNQQEEELECDSFQPIVQRALDDISFIAQYYDLFEFKDEEEKADYYLMKEWIKIKKETGYSEKDLKVLQDGLNIISIKTANLMDKMIEAIQQAVKKDGVGSGISSIGSKSMDAIYDYHEFKNGKRRDEITLRDMNYIKTDLKLTREGKKMSKSKKVGGR